MNMEFAGIIKTEKYAGGSIKSYNFDKKNVVKTKYGDLIPKYGDENARRRYTPSVTFYESGEIKSVDIETQTKIKTSIGEYPAEFVTFYKSGNIKRLFPLNGKISGFWTEQDEAGLCEEYAFELGIGKFRAKIIGMCFYESGKLRSMTLWPGQDIVLNTNVGLLPVRIGFSLHEDGSIETIEPAYDITVSTPIGNIAVFDSEAVGVNGDKNSLEFDKDGNILCFTTTSKIAVFPENGAQETVGPVMRPNPLDDEGFVPVPLKVVFDGGMVYFYNDIDDVKQYPMDGCRFVPINENPVTGSGCMVGGDCSSCSLCSGK